MPSPHRDRPTVGRRSSRWPVVALALTGIALLSGCGGSSDSEGITSSTSSETTSTSASTAETTETTEAATTTTAPCQPVSPSDDVQAIVDSAGPGRELCFSSGRYEGFSVVPLTGQRFVASDGAVLDGLGEQSHAFVTTAERKADDVIIEGFEMTGYVSSERCSTFRSDCGDVPVRGGVIFPHVSVDADALPDVLVEETSSLRWVVRNNHLHDNMGTAISMGEAMTVEFNVITHNSHLGIGGGTVGDLVIVSNQFDDNSYDDRIPPYWEAGQIKLGFIHDSQISDNSFLGGVGPAIWCDVVCANIDIDGNEISGIDRGLAVGIFYEISEDARITGNTITGSHGTCLIGDGAGILVSESRRVEVSDNTVTDSDSLIVVQALDRNRFQSDLDHLQVTVSEDTDGLWMTQDVNVTNNSLGNSEAACDTAPGGHVGLNVQDADVHANTTDVEAGVTFSGNDYRGTEDTIGYVWPTSAELLSWDSWMELGLE